MKRTTHYILLIALLICSLGASAGSRITRIDPTDWFVGMKNSELQLMVYGDDIRDANLTTDYAGVRIDSLVRLDSPNYLLVYLNLEGAKAGTMTLHFTFPKGKGKRKMDVKYTLKDREMGGDKRQGFTNADVLYMLMPDRFANGRADNDQIEGMNKYTVNRDEPSLRHGGDLEGIRQHLDYFTELGVTALWFTPVLENNSPDEGEFSTYHGYATTDYYQVDPRFGSNEEYRQLVDEAHAKGLKVVMDMIFNHCGLYHPWLADLPSHDWLNTPEWLSEAKKNAGDDAKQRGDAINRVSTKIKNNGSEDSKLFNLSTTNTSYLQTSYKLTPVVDPYASKIDMKETVEGWFVPTMPDLNQRNKHVLRYLIQNSFWWIETVGIDGIRMDTYPYADRDGMAEWMKELAEEYPNFNVVGETWVTEPAYTAAWQKDSRLSKHNSRLTTVMDFSFYDKINQAKKEQTDGWWNGFNRIYNSLVYDYLYEDANHVMAFIENHDTDRFLGNGQDVDALKQALALLLTLKRTPQLYYGTEILMNGTKEKTDGYVRKDFPGGFKDDPKDCFTSAGRSAEQNEMFTWLSHLLHWRQGNDVIIKGSQTQFIPQNGVYVIARQYAGKTVLTILNGTDEQQTMHTERYKEVIGDAKTATNVITKQAVNIAENMILAPREALVVEY